MSYLIKYDHSRFDKYAEDQINSVINISKVLNYLSKGALTRAELSRIINPPEELERGRSKYNIYKLTLKLRDWSYITCTIDLNEYDNSYPRYTITNEGRELKSIIPAYLAKGERSLHNARIECEKLDC